MARSTNESIGKCSQYSVPNSSAKKLDALTSSPSFAHFINVFTIYRFVLLCFLFGAMSILTGVSLISLSLVFRAKTMSTQLLESVPLYMPGLIVSG